MIGQTLRPLTATRARRPSPSVPPTCIERRVDSTWEARPFGTRTALRGDDFLERILQPVEHLPQELHRNSQCRLDPDNLRLGVRAGHENAALEQTGCNPPTDLLSRE